MRVNRRDFIKLSAAGAGALALDWAISGEAEAQQWPLVKRVGEKSTICAYCSVGCGALVASEGNNVVSIEGDPDHPINRGALCSKGFSLMQWAHNNNPRRLTKVLYRAPASPAWEIRDWDWALGRIAENVRRSRDAGFVETQDGVTVNRCESIACLGGATLNNEEGYLYAKLARSLGIVYLEHQARI